MPTEKKPKLTHDWDEQQKKIRLLNFVGIGIGALVVILVIIFLLRGHH